MKTLYVVAATVGGYAREDSANASVVGAYLNPKTADAVRKVAGHGATVTPVEIDFIPAGLVDAMGEFGIKLPSEAVISTKDKIQSVIDRVLWTADATAFNRKLLAEAIEEELGPITL